nr:immunoglobulin light chain junction region [Macaca mulatta]MOV94132.1 immunoglobulin light chain junction region [Macaca mulatta]
CLQDKQLPPTF